jgi:hypothetical protein
MQNRTQMVMIVKIFLNRVFKSHNFKLQYLNTLLKPMKKIIIIHKNHNHLRSIFCGFVVFYTPMSIKRS